MNANPLITFSAGVIDDATLPQMFERLIGNLHGFAYRRRHDAAWTMEFLSDGCRDLTGYDPHRFIENQSLSFADLLVTEDRPRVLNAIGFAIAQRRRTTVTYRLRCAFGRIVTVEDRLTPVYNESGEIEAIEGIIDYANRISAPRVREPDSLPRHAPYFEPPSYPRMGKL